MNDLSRDKRLSDVYNSNKDKIVRILRSDRIPPEQKCLVRLSIAEICALSADILDDMRAGGADAQRMRSARLVDRAWRELLVLATTVHALESRMGDQTRAA